ncbi:hypothetical protein C1X64_17545 [Pseudomonas sp. GW456-E7]|nr:hypothetical protein C1X64_17545 [Pseudomonas sp. GW456-E7]
MASHSTHTRLCPPVGASLLAMGVNDDAFILEKRGALKSIASKLAPTEEQKKARPKGRALYK